MTGMTARAAESGKGAPDDKVNGAPTATGHTQARWSTAATNTDPASIRRAQAAFGLIEGGESDDGA